MWHLANFPLVPSLLLFPLDVSKKESSDIGLLLPPYNYKVAFFFCLGTISSWVSYMADMYAVQSSLVNRSLLFDR